MKRRIFLLHSLLLLCFIVTAVSSYGYNEQFVVDGIRYFHLGYGRCQAIGVTDTTEVVRIPDVVYDGNQPYRVELNFGKVCPCAKVWCIVPNGLSTLVAGKLQTHRHSCHPFPRE